MSDTIDLPSVAGRMEMTHADFRHACQVELGRLQEDPNRDTHLLYLLCEAVRCSRECCEIATAKTIDWKARCEAAEAHNIKITREWSVQVTEMRKELERVQKAAAEMREAIWAALPALRELARGGNQAAEDAAGLVNDALSADAGRDYHHRDELERVRDEHDKEIGEFQNEVRDLVIKLSGAPDSEIDGKGSDAGWQEFTLAEISQGFAWLKDHHRDEFKPLGEALNRLWDLGEMGYIVEDGKPSECGECGSIGAHSLDCFQGTLEQALTYARQKGLIP